MPKAPRRAFHPEEPDLPALPLRCEWLFRRVDVPDDEIVACTCWEYLREIPSEHFGSAGLAGYAQLLLISYRTHDAQRKFNDSYDRIPTNILLLLAAHPDLASTLQPWQELDQNVRQKLNQSMPRAWEPLIALDVFALGLTSWEMKIPAPGDFKGPRPWKELELELYAWAVAHEARRRTMDRQEAGSDQMRAIPQTADLEKRSDAIRNFPIDDPRNTLIFYASNELACPSPFLINWGEYTADEIVDAFRAWVHRVHPKFGPSPRGKGTKMSALRGALRNLAAMRIMEAMPAEEFIERYDADYQLFQKPWDGKEAGKKLPHVDLAKLRSNAVGFFQEHFASSPDMKPRSWRKPRTVKRTLAKATGDLPEFKARKKTKNSAEEL